MRFKDKVAIVTGGAGGIGEAICRRLAAEGALVRVVDMNGAAAARLAAEIGGTAHDVDLTDPAAIHAFVADIAPDGIDVLCNNAGLMRRGSLMELTAADWQASFAVNVDALFHICLLYTSPSPRD